MPNAIWVWNETPVPQIDPVAVANNCIAGKIDIIIPVLGHWNTDGSITFDQNQANVKTWISTVKSKNPNFKVLGCVICVNPWTPTIDVSSASMRNTMVSNMVATVNNLGLDGWNDDTECINPDSSAVAWYNAMGVAMRNIGKLSSCCVMNYGGWLSVVSAGVVIDYLFPMCYNGATTGSSLTNCITTQINTSKSPLIIGLGRYNVSSISDLMSGVDGLSAANKSKLKGLCIFDYSFMTSSDWSAWNNWVTKNQYAGITSPSVLTSITIVPASISVSLNGTAQLTATCKDQNGNTMTCPALTWSSADSSKVTVNSTGKVTGIANGTANVTAKSGIITSNASIITVTSTPPIPPSTGNLLLNPEFELGTTNNPANWAAVTSDGVVSNYVFTYPEVGRTGNAVAIQKKVANTTRAYYVQTVTLPTSISSFILSGYIKTSNVVVDAHIQIDWYDASGWMAYNQSNVVTGTVANWTPVQVIAPKPSGATYAIIDLVLYSTGSTDKAWFDGIYFGDSSITPVEKKFSVSNVTPGSTINKTGVVTVLDPAGTFTKDQACTEACRLLGLI